MRALLVTNPKATATSPRRRDVIIRALSNDLQLHVAHTDHRGHAIELGRQAVHDEIDLVIVLGGDGTVNELVNGMLSEGPGQHVPRLAALPGGSASVFARALGFPADLVDATGSLLEAIRERRERPIGLGTVGGRYFVFAAGYGFDAEVVRGVELRRGNGKKATPTLYARTAIREYLTGGHSRHPSMTVHLPDGRDITGVFLSVITNTTPWTYYRSRAVQVTPRASFQTGLDLFALNRVGPVTVARLLWQVMRNDPKIGGRRIHSAHDLSRLRISSAVPLPLQVDGDYAGEHTEVTLRSVPQALRVVG